MRSSPIPVRSAEPDLARPPLLLLPGMVCNHRSWASQIENLADLAAPRVVDYQQDQSLEAMAKRVLSTTSQHFYMAGHSMGARVAIEVARQAPDRILGMCLIATEHRASPSGDQGAQEQAGRLALLDTAKRFGMWRMAQDWLPMLVPPERQGDAALASEIMTMIAEHSPQQLAAHIQAGANRPDTSDLLPTLHIPTLLVAGSNDRIRPPQALKDMADLLPDCALEVIQDCGHMPTMEHADAVNKSMRAWLRTPRRAQAINS